VDSSIYEATAEYTPVIDLLVPFGDNLFRSFRIEQLTQLLLRSDLRDRALESDPINTYEKAVIDFPGPAQFATDAPMDIVFINNPAIIRQAEEGTTTVNCEVDPVAKTLTTEFGVQSFTHADNLTSSIPIIPGRDIRLQGPLPALTFTFILSYVNPVGTDWPRLVQRVDSGNYQFQDAELRRIFQEDINWVNRVSAIVLLAVENSNATVLR
jgi:hypothetical protein